MTPDVHVIGAGLAGSECAYRCAEAGLHVVLHEMRPIKYSPAHHSGRFAELVCSNSLRSDSLSNGVGLLKEEMRRMGSLVMEAADATRVPAGSALAVDRILFADYITNKVKSHKNVTVVTEECLSVDPDALTVIATGPLTSDGLSAYIQNELGCAGLHFFDAAAPIVDGETVDMDVAFYASRYDKGDADYVNCPMTREQYDAFYNALITAEEAELKDFDKESQSGKEPTVFEGCMPVEIMARRGYDTLRFGPLKPVGLTDKRTGKESYAVVQLRRENTEGTTFNLVGFQTHLTYPEQKRVFRMIPGLENAEFLRYGTMHRNTYLNSPTLLNDRYQLKSNENVFFAGQITGVEGYVESAASGLCASVYVIAKALGKTVKTLPTTTMIGAMANYVATGSLGRFTPMNANFGIIPMPDHKIKGGKTVRNAYYASRSLDDLDAWLKEKENDRDDRV